MASTPPKLAISCKDADQESLDLILDNVHDREVDLENIRYDEATGVLTLPVDYFDYDDAICRRNLFIYRTDDIPVLKAKLEIHGVRNWKLVQDPDEVYFMLNHIHISDTAIEITGVPGRFELAGEGFTLNLAVFEKRIGTARQWSFLVMDGDRVIERF